MKEFLATMHKEESSQDRVLEKRDLDRETTLKISRAHIKMQKEKKNVLSKYKIIANLCSYITLRENNLKSESTMAGSQLKMMNNSIF